MPSQYLILRQSGQVCEVVFVDSDKQTNDVRFSGGRWAARRFLRTLRSGVGYESIPAFCEKAGRNGHAGSCIEIPFNSPSPRQRRAPQGGEHPREISGPTFAKLPPMNPTATFAHLKLWTRPSHYMGATWFDYYPLAGQSRDSSALEESNFRSWLALLKHTCAKQGIPTDIPNPDFGATADAQGYGPAGNLVCDETTAAWTVERSSHWAVGWVETLLVHSSADPRLLALCDDTLAKLDGYPVLDENDYSELETEQANTVWRDCYSVSERAKYIRAHKSQFEFRDFADMLGCVRGNYFAGYASELIS